VIDVPAVVRNRARAAGAGDWLERLPAIVSCLEAGWSITVGHPYGGGSEAFVAEATRADGTPAVLKVLVPGPGTTPPTRRPSCVSSAETKPARGVHNDASRGLETGARFGVRRASARLTTMSITKRSARRSPPAARTATARNHTGRRIHRRKHPPPAVERCPRACALLRNVTGFRQRMCAISAVRRGQGRHGGRPTRVNNRLFWAADLLAVGWSPPSCSP
jgi:hypothetical protein